MIEIGIITLNNNSITISNYNNYLFQSQTLDPCDPYDPSRYI